MESRNSFKEPHEDEVLESDKKTAILCIMHYKGAFLCKHLQSM